MDETINQNPTPPAYDASLSGEEEGSSLKKIVSIIIGVFVLLLIIAVAFIFIYPRLSTNKADEKVELVYWGVWEEQAVLSPIFAEFTRSRPNVTIKYEKQDIKGLKKYVERIKTRINNGSGPDLFRFHNSWVPQLKEFLLPLPSDVVSSVELENKFYPVVKKDLKRDGAYYGVPLGIDTLALFVNNTTFKAAGEDFPTAWDDFLKASLRLTVKQDQVGTIENSGAALGTVDNIAHFSDIASLLLVQNGANLTDITKTNNNAIQALEFYTCFALDNVRCQKVWDQGQDNSKLAFAKGILAMYFGYSWDILEIKAANPNLDFSILPVPQIPGGRKDTIASYWVEGVSVKSKHSKEAFELLKFLGKKETLEKLYAEQSKVRLIGVPYPRTDMAELLRSNTLLFPFVQQAQNAVSTPFAADTYDDAMNAALNVYLGNAIKSILNGTSVETAVETLSAGVTQVVSRYGQ